MSKSAIDFIVKDVSRAGRRGRGAVFGLCALLALCPAVLGLGMREGFEGATDPRVLSLNVAAALTLGLALLAGVRSGFSSRVASAWVVLGLSLLLAVERGIGALLGLTAQATHYASSEVFWTETSRCFVKGACVSAVTGALLCVAIFTLFSWPTRRWRVAIAAAVGVSAAVMLGFHCDSASAGHLLVGHIGSGMLVTGLVFAAEEITFSLLLRSELPGLLGKLPRPRRLG